MLVTEKRHDDLPQQVGSRGKMKLLLVVPDGVAIRNFLCSRFIDLWTACGEVVVWHALSNDIVSPYQQQWSGKVRWQSLPPMREGIASRIIRQAKARAQLYWQREYPPLSAPRHEWSLSSLYAQGVALAAKAIGRAAAGPRRLRWLEKLHAFTAWRSRGMAAHLEYLKREKPDVVFCTHQRASRAVCAILAAQKLGIPTATFIYSWDNLPKGRMAVYPDYFLVWSQHMKEELLRYYPEVSSGRVLVTGTPQFEHYFNEALLLERGAFLESLGLDPGRPVICFSGDDVTTSPYDPIYLADLAEALRSIGPGTDRPQILFRRSPVDLSGRFASVLEEYPEIAVCDPLWSAQVEEDWTQVVPTKEDVALLVNVVRNCDAVVNFASTMAMDFAIADKPAIYLAYNPPQSLGDPSWSAEAIYGLPHFRIVHELQPAYWATAKQSLASLVTHMLTHREEKSDLRRQWLERTVTLPLDRASERLNDSLRKIAREEAGVQQTQAVSIDRMGIGSR